MKKTVCHNCYSWNALNIPLCPLFLVLCMNIFFCIFICGKAVGIFQNLCMRISEDRFFIAGRLVLFGNGSGLDFELSTLAKFLWYFCVLQRRLIKKLKSVSLWERMSFFLKQRNQKMTQNNVQFLKPFLTASFQKNVFFKYVNFLNFSVVLIFVY